MKIRSLLLGSVAAAGLATGAQAADLGVLTSLDVCDSLGLSGLTISSDTNCLQITGEVSYRFQWGDWRATETLGTASTPASGFSTAIGAADGTLDWSSKMLARLGVVATANSEFGPAAAHISFLEISDLRSNTTVIANQNVPPGNPFFDFSDTRGVVLEEAWVSVGDSTVIMAGRKGSIANFGTDTPYNFLGLWQSSANGLTPDWNTIQVGALSWNGIGDQFAGGVNFNGPGSDLRFGGDVIQITTDLGNGFYASAGLENIQDGILARAGTLVGVVGYNGDNITAHVTGVAGGILDGVIEDFGIHAGAEARFDNFKLTGAIAANDAGWINGLASGQATFDIFTLAVSGEFTAQGGAFQSGAGASISAKVTDGVALNVGGRFFNDGANTLSQGEIRVVADVTETIKLTGGVGAYHSTLGGQIRPYATGIVAWNPGGGFTTSLQGDVITNTTAGNGFGFRTQFSAGKKFN